MIRPFTCLCLIAALGSGLYLYSEKHRTAMLDREIGRVVRATQDARERTGLLRAEWALLNEPGRLQQMAERYLALKTMAPTQFVQLAELGSRLPAPVAQPQPGAADEDEAAEIADRGAAGAAQADPLSASAAASASGSASASPPAPGDLGAGPSWSAQASGEAAAHLPAKTPAKLVARAEPKARPSHHVALADRQGGMTQRSSPLPLAAPQPLGATVFSAMARPMPMGARPAIVAARPSYASYAPTVVGSALGGQGSLPPPVPYAGR